MIKGMMLNDLLCKDSKKFIITSSPCSITKIKMLKSKRLSCLSQNKTAADERRAMIDSVSCVDHNYMVNTVQPNGMNICKLKMKSALSLNNIRIKTASEKVSYITPHNQVQQLNFMRGSYTSLDINQLVREKSQRPIETLNQKYLQQRKQLMKESQHQYSLQQKHHIQVKNDLLNYLFKSDDYTINDQKLMIDDQKFNIKEDNKPKYNSKTQSSKHKQFETIQFRDNKNDFLKRINPSINKNQQVFKMFQIFALEKGQRVPYFLT